MTQGDLFVISAPSGAGKTTLCEMVLREVPDIGFSVSHTTRLPRTGEVAGRDYHFVSRKEFDEMVSRGDFLEWASVHGNCYGTSKQEVFSRLDVGQDVLLDIDVQGARQVREQFPGAVLIFILPPSMSVLEDRLRARGTEDAEWLKLRLENAELEVKSASDYNYIVINDELPHALEDLKAIIRARRLRAQRVLSQWKM